MMHTQLQKSIFILVNTSFQGSSCLSRINITAGDPEISIHIVVYENILLQMLEHSFFCSKMFDIFRFFVTGNQQDEVAFSHNSIIIQLKFLCDDVLDP